MKFGKSQNFGFFRFFLTFFDDFVDFSEKKIEIFQEKSKVADLTDKMSKKKKLFFSELKLHGNWLCTNFYRNPTTACGQATRLTDF